MGFLPDLFGKNNGMLKSPGDKFTAEVTPTGKGVMKLKTQDINTTAVIYPGENENTIVETRTYKCKK